MKGSLLDISALSNRTCSTWLELQSLLKQRRRDWAPWYAKYPRNINENDHNTNYASGFGCSWVKVSSELTLDGRAWSASILVNAIGDAPGECRSKYKYISVECLNEAYDL